LNSRQLLKINPQCFIFHYDIIPNVQHLSLKKVQLSHQGWEYDTWQKLECSLDVHH